MELDTSSGDSGAGEKMGYLYPTMVTCWVIWDSILGVPLLPRNLTWKLKMMVFEGELPFLGSEIFQVPCSISGV